MSNIFTPKKVFFSLAQITLSLFIMPQAFAAGFALQEQSGSGLGNAYAGGAAVAEDAAVMWFNPAAMTRLQGTHLAIAGYAINNNRSWDDKGSTKATGQSLGGSTDISPTAYVPNLYLTTQINDQAFVGFGLNIPFGLKTDYANDWVGRYQGVGADIKTKNLSAAFAYKASPSLSLSAGLDWQMLDATLTQMSNYAVIAAGVAQSNPAAIPGAIASLGGNTESLTKVNGSDSSWGYNLGAHYQLSKQTDIGFHYRSAIRFHLTGTVSTQPPTSSGNALSPFINGQIAQKAASSGITADITTPAIANLSFFHRLNDRIDVMADAQWTQWSTVPKLEFVRTNGDVLSSTTYKWRDAYRLSIGANYKLTDTLKLKTGLAYDQSPIPEQYRTVRLPDNDRYWLSAGLQYAINPKTKLDIGYTYVMVKNADLNNRREDNDSAGQISGTLNGTFHQHVHILGIQLSYQF